MSTTSTLRDRLWSIIEAVTTQSRRFKELEIETGIASDRWKALALGRQRPTAEMIEAAAKCWPQFAFWLVTGITDPIRGHIAPLTLFPVVKGKLQIYAELEWKYKLKLVKNISLETNPETKTANWREEQGRLLAEEADVPAVFRSYEQVMELYGEPKNYQFVELLLDDELRHIEKMRMHEERAISNAKEGYEQNLDFSLIVDSWFKLGKKFGNRVVKSVGEWFSIKG